MTRCRLHVILPDDTDVPDGIDWNESMLEELREDFDDTFGLVETAAVQENQREWVSEVFEETDQTMDLVDEFEETCDDLFPEIDTMMTRQQRDVMDGRGEEFEYDDVLMLQLTFKLVD